MRVTQTRRSPILSRGAMDSGEQMCGAENEGCTGAEVKIGNGEMRGEFRIRLQKNSILSLFVNSQRLLRTWMIRRMTQFCHS
jgi:hypothetical protein